MLFLTVCLGLSVFQTTFAANGLTTRTTSKRGTTAIVKQQPTGRTTTATSQRTQSSEKNTRSSRTTQQRVKSRTTNTQNNRQQKNTVQEQKNNRRASATSRVVSSRSTASRQAEQKKAQPKATARTALSGKKITRASKTAELNEEKITNIKSLNYSKCKTVYYECMDEFCANKDTNLRRCACSSRIHEFDDIKKQLSEAEDKMLDFNQRLLTVSLDKEDAAAINVASDGEKAFAKKDTTESEKLLQKITNTLNSSSDSKINNDLSSVSLSLDIDSAWDNVDSMAGAATSAKSGTNLYNAARPVCIEMAREVCTEDELNIAQNGYKLTIQQDCDTVAKSYKTQYSTAMEKIHESGALLDMSRLNVYQQNNSDDTLTCKKKILTQLTEPSVCGENLYKCLDTTGQYIDPSTGSAFLSENLANLANLLKEPTNGERWSKVPSNESFVNFLNSKKKFLEPAVKQCQDIADMVWQEFIDDALAQIKLAQNTKLEEIKRSCTKLISECETEALESLADFDARALSTFGIDADKTVDKMCSETKTACANLMNSNELLTDWDAGISGITTDISYQKIVETCTTVGRNCIVQQCNGTSGNFALCQKTTDDNRRAILNREVCWNKILECVQKSENLDSIPVLERNEYYRLYYNMSSDAPTLCANSSDKACLITEQIWGNCESLPDSYTITTNENLVDNEHYVNHNMILKPNNGASLLSWFAANTGTANNKDSCNSNGCPIDYERLQDGTCQQLNTTVTTTSDCGNPTNSKQIINVTANITNYCENGVLDIYGNCCATNAKNNGICVPSQTWQAARLMNLTCTNTDDYFCSSTGNMTLYCVTSSNSPQPVVYYSVSAEYECLSGFWVIVDENGNYFNADKNENNKVQMFYNEPATTCDSQPLEKCAYGYDNNAWGWDSQSCSVSSVNGGDFFIEYLLSQ